MGRGTLFGPPFRCNDYDSWGESACLYVIDPATRTLRHSPVIGGSTRHVVFTADGSIGLVPNEGGWVDFIK